MADETLDIEDVADTGDYLSDDEDDVDIEMDEADEAEADQAIAGQMEKYDIKIVDWSKTFDEMKEVKEKVTIPYLTKYERVKLIGYRASQLARGAVPTVQVGDLTRVEDIAIKELDERKMPLIVRRYLPNKKYEDWRLDELIF